MANVVFFAILGLGGLASGLLQATGGYSEKLSPGGVMIVTAWLAWGARLFLKR